MKIKKDDFFVYSLAALFIIAFATDWNIIIKIAVILNSIVVLAQVGYRFMRLRKCD